MPSKQDAIEQLPEPPPHSPAPAPAPHVLLVNDLPEQPPAPVKPPIGGLLNVGVGGGKTGIAARVGIGIQPLEMGHWSFGVVYGIGLTGGTSASGWFDMELPVQATWKTPLWHGKLGFTLGAGPALAWARGNDCDSPLCGYVPASPMSVQGAFQAQGGWWLTQQSDEWELGFVLAGQSLTNGVFDVTANIVLLVVDLRNLYPLIMQ